MYFLEDFDVVLYFICIQFHIRIRSLCFGNVMLKTVHKLDVAM